MHAQETCKMTLGDRKTDQKQVVFSNIIGALSFALDLTEGACPGHALRTCILGMRLGEALGLGEDTLDELYFALLLKDVGCSSNSSRLYQIVGDDEIRAKQLTKTVDWTRFEWKQMHYLLKHAHSKESGTRRLKGIASMVMHSSQNAEILMRLRCDKGAKVVRDLGLGTGTAGAIYCLDEHWDGMGYPDRLAGDDIPLLARIVSIAQTAEVFHRLYGAPEAMDVLSRRSGRWFDPALVKAMFGLHRRDELWLGMADDELRATVACLQPLHKRVLTDSFMIDQICVAFAGVVDAKSPYTYKHSNGVARAAVQIGRCLNLPTRDLTILRRASLLHDIGKLSVPNSILDKPGKLSSEEWECVKQHPHYTFEILRRVSGFDQIAEVASCHHEKLDGSGYHRGMMGQELCKLARILTVADMFDALSGERPYRERLALDQVLGILRQDAPHAIDAECFSALESFAEEYQVA